MDIITKIIGLVAIFFGFAAWYVDYFIFSAIGALAAALATAVGITGAALLGMQILGWLIVLGLLSLLFILGSILIYIGLKFLKE